MTSSGTAIAWRGHIADETDEDFLSKSTTMGDRDLVYVEIPSREKVSSAEPPFRNVLIFPIEAYPEEIASIDQTLESLIEEKGRKDVSTNEYGPIEIDIEHDVVVQIPPLKRRSVRVRVTSIRGAVPHVVYYPIFDE